MYQVVPGSYKPYQSILCTTCSVTWTGNRNQTDWEYDCRKFISEHIQHNLLVKDMTAEDLKQIAIKAFKDSS